MSTQRVIVQPACWQPRSKLSGFSLVELMVAMAIGLVLIVAIAAAFVGARGTHKAQDDTARMQENIRFASATLERVIRMAGYRSNPGIRASDVFAAPNQALLGVEGGGVVNDQLTVRFQGDGRPIPGGSIANSPGNCAGTTTAFGVISSNVFSITTDAQGVPWLSCNGQTLVPDVQAMQILYGEDLSGAAQTSAQRYVTAAQVSDFNRVTSVRIYLLIRSATASAPTTDTSTYRLAETMLGPFDDRRVRRVVTLTIAVRNNETPEV